jgi:hypothetical protein
VSSWDFGEPLSDRPGCDCRPTWNAKPVEQIVDVPIDGAA